MSIYDPIPHGDEEVPIGIFYIDPLRMMANPDEVKLIMGRCIILSATYEPEYFRWRYAALSDDFRPLPRGYSAPTYTWLFEQQDGVMKVIGVKG